MNETLENQKNIASDIVMPLADEEIQEMMKAGLHIGHVSSKTHPKMASFIYVVRNGISIFDLIQTKEKLHEAEAVLKKLFSEGKTILFVGAKPPVRKLLMALHEQHDVPVVTERWIGGTLTNFKVISGRIQQLENLLKEKGEGGFKKYTKKEAMKKEDEIRHLEKTFGGIRKLKKLPDALFLADIDENELAVREAKRIGISTIAVTDSNTNPALVDYPIPANDTSIPSLSYIISRVEKSLTEGKKAAEKAKEKKEVDASISK